jgi:hypothetical protein
MVVNPAGNENGVKAGSEAPVEDPAVSRFLHFLEVDVHYRPDRLKVVDFHLLSRINLLVDQMEVDLNAALFAEDE